MFKKFGNFCKTVDIDNVENSDCILVMDFNGESKPNEITVYFKNKRIIHKISRIKQNPTYFVKIKDCVLEYTYGYFKKTFKKNVYCGILFNLKLDIIKDSPFRRAVAEGD